MNIQDLETKYKELGAEIERLKQQPEGVWEPEVGGDYWYVYSSGELVYEKDFSYAADQERKGNHNVYKTEALAEKASVLMRRSNLVIQACLNFDPDFDPDFEPDWSEKYPSKFGVIYYHALGEWCYRYTWSVDDSAAYVSTREIADKVVAYLNSQEIK